MHRTPNLTAQYTKVLLIHIHNDSNFNLNLVNEVDVNVVPGGRPKHG